MASWSIIFVDGKMAMTKLAIYLYLIRLISIVSAVYSYKLYVLTDENF